MYNSNTQRKILSHLIASCKALPEYSVIPHIHPNPQSVDSAVTKWEREAIPCPSAAEILQALKAPLNQATAT